VGSLFFFLYLRVQAAEQAAHPISGPRGRPGLSSNRCIQIGEQPKKSKTSSGWLSR